MKISELKKSIFNFLKSNFFNNFEFRIHFEMRDDDRNLLAIDTTVSTSNDKTPPNDTHIVKRCNCNP